MICMDNGLSNTNLLRNNSVFIGLSLVLLAVLGLALLYIPQGELHLLLCDHHTHARDIFFRYYTHVAEWFPYVICVALLLFGRIGDGAFASAAMLLSALSTQLFKHIFNAPRPLSWFDLFMPDTQLPLVEGVKMNYWYSFPSGHTTTFFALFFALSIISGQHLAAKPSAGKATSRQGELSAAVILLQVAFFALAALGGYSRIYLSQHFAADVLAGMAVGIVITTICYAVLHRYEGQKWYNYRVFGNKERQNAKK